MQRRTKVVLWLVLALTVASVGLAVAWSLPVGDPEIEACFSSVEWSGPPATPPTPPPCTPEPVSP